MGLADDIEEARNKQRDAELVKREYLAAEAATARLALPALKQHLVEARDVLLQAGVAPDEEREWRRYADGPPTKIYPAGWPLGQVGRFFQGLWLRADGGLATSVPDMARSMGKDTYHVPYDLEDEDIVELWTYHGQHAESRGFYLCGGSESWSCCTLERWVTCEVMRKLGLPPGPLMTVFSERRRA